jgi:hypothetical protein
MREANYLLRKRLREKGGNLGDGEVLVDGVAIGDFLEIGHD